MQMVPSDVEKGMPEPPVWKHFQATLNREEGEWVKVTQNERFSFYERAKKAFAIIATSDTALYANLIIKKGVVA